MKMRARANSGNDIALIRWKSEDQQQIIVSNLNDKNIIEPLLQNESNQEQFGDSNNNYGDINQYQPVILNHS